MTSRRATACPRIPTSARPAASSFGAWRRSRSRSSSPRSLRHCSESLRRAPTGIWLGRSRQATKSTSPTWSADWVRSATAVGNQSRWWGSSRCAEESSTSSCPRASAPSAWNCSATKSNPFASSIPAPSARSGGAIPSRCCRCTSTRPAAPARVCSLPAGSSRQSARSGAPTHCWTYCLMPWCCGTSRGKSSRRQRHCGSAWRKRAPGRTAVPACITRPWNTGCALRAPDGRWRWTSSGSTLGI